MMCVCVDGVRLHNERDTDAELDYANSYSGDGLATCIVRPQHGRHCSDWLWQDTGGEFCVTHASCHSLLVHTVSDEHFHIFLG